MSSSIKLKNANGKTVSVTNSNANQTDKEVIYLNTVDELANASGSINAVAIISDLDRGGTFEWSATGTANGGTVFAGASGYWNRQYSGAVNVKWFGASVESSALNNTDAITKALNYTSIIGGGIVDILESGAYLVSPIAGDVVFNLPSNVHIRGGGINITTLKLDGNSNAHIINVNSQENISISDITLDGNKDNQTSFGTHCFRAVNCNGININNVHATNGCRYGIGIQYSGAYEPSLNIKITNCELSYNGVIATGGDGIDIKHGVNVYLENIYSHHNIENGIDCRASNGTYIGCIAEYNDNGILLRGNPLIGDSIGERGWTINASACHSNFNTSSGFVITTNDGLYALHATLDGCFASHNGKHGFSVEDTYIHSMFTGCHSKYNAEYGFNLKSSGLSKASYVACVARRNNLNGFGLRPSAETTTDVIGCEAVYNGIHGLQVIEAHNAVVTGGMFSYNTASGIRTNIGSSIINSTMSHNTSYGLDNIVSTNVRVIGNSVSGNTISQIRAVPSIASNSTIRDNIGLKTSGYFLSSNLALDSTGTKTAIITHNFGYTPSKASISATFIQNTAVTDFEIGFISIEAVSSTTFGVRVRVVVASATVGAVFNVACKIDATNGI